jgi:hypothetical protein
MLLSDIAVSVQVDLTIHAVVKMFPQKLGKKTGGTTRGGETRCL